MRQYAKITPEGTRDYLFEECRARDALRNSLTQVFDGCGYAPVATPHMEFYDVFRRPSAEGLADRFYSATDSRGRLLVLRPDSTLPIARIAATRLQHAALPLRLYYHQSVLRRSRFYSGHSDETLQSGVELLGAEGLRADLEILALAAQALKACDAPRFRIELGHADIFRCLADSLNVSGELRRALAEAIETKNFPALQELLRPFGSVSAAQALRKLPKLFGGEAVLAQAKSLYGGAQYKKTLAYLSALYAALKELGLHEHIDIDLGLVHGQQYYTGLVFRGYIEGSGKTVLSGGRYDALLAEFGRPAAAVGFAIELDPLAELLLEEDGARFASPPAVAVFGAAGFEAAALGRAAALREAGECCICAMCQTAEEATEFARARGIPRLIILDGTGEQTISGFTTV